MGASAVTMKFVYLFIGYICLVKFRRLAYLLSAGISGRQMIFVLRFHFLDMIFVVTFCGDSFSLFRMIVILFC